MKISIVNKLPWLFAFMPGLALAANDMGVDNLLDAAKRSGDLSRQLLKLIFGEVIENPLNFTGDGGLLGNVIFSFNGAVLALAIIYLGWISLKKTTRGAQLGQIMEQGTDTGNKFVKTTVGFISLIPTPAGWNVAQLFFLWAAALAGVGAGNIVSDKVASELGRGQTLYTQPVMPEMVSVAKSMFETNLCALGINHGLEQQKASGEGYESRAEMKVKAITNDPRRYSVEITNGSASCGGFTLKPAIIPGAGSEFVSITNTIRDASRTMFDSMREAAKEFNEAYFARLRGDDIVLSDVETKIQQAAREYQRTVGNSINMRGMETTQLRLLTQEMEEKGWMAIGGYFRLISSANTSLQNVASHTPVVFGVQPEGDYASLDYFQGLFQAYHSQLKNSTYTPALGGEGSNINAIERSSSNEKVDPSDVSGIISRLIPWEKFFQAKWGSGDGETELTNPILKIKEVGDWTMGLSEMGLAAWFGLNVGEKVVKNNIGGRVVNFFTGIGDAADEGLRILNGWVYTALMVLIIVGGIMSVYIPLIPVINWLVAVTDWLIAVVTGSVASTMWAATHLNVGESNADRSQTGYIFLIDVLIRPLLMVIGFLFATLTIIALGTLVDVFLVPMFRVAQGTSTAGLVTFIFFLLCYARIMGGLVLRVFTLPVRLPNWVISWIGNRGYDSILGDMSSHISGIFGGLSRITRSPGAGSSSSKVPSGDGMDGK
ncbi:DotA/TraY family protein [Xenorhabdus sp. KJ12.1]|uniref:DotA/TraY family protein n=1 Tax=Xenorhabdus sp. KJ12.1 TaxID=1851571 RepID=UPI000C03D14C|nr:DotA/TraY family protein [Xenorhabdus sp. KJ12.1]PHM67988.1 DotA [Xenorhabdus sp. KJ12.1]